MEAIAIFLALTVFCKVAAIGLFAALYIFLLRWILKEFEKQEAEENNDKRATNIEVTIISLSVYMVAKCDVICLLLILPIFPLRWILKRLKKQENKEANNDGEG